MEQQEYDKKYLDQDMLGKSYKGPKTIFQDCFTRTIFHVSYTCPDLEAAKHWYCDVLGCSLTYNLKFGMYGSIPKGVPGFIVGMAGHHVSIIEGPSSIPQYDDKWPRHYGPIFLDYHEYMAIAKHCVEHPEINCFKSRWNERPGRKDRELETVTTGMTQSGQNVPHHKTVICDPWYNWLEFKYYALPQQIHAKGVDKEGRNVTSGYPELYGKSYADLEKKYPHMPHLTHGDGKPITRIEGDSLPALD